MLQLTTVSIVGGDKGLDLEVTVPKDELREAEAKEYKEQEGVDRLNGDKWGVDKRTV